VIVVKDDGRVAGGTARTMQADCALFRNRQESVGEIITQVFLGGKGQTPYVINAFNGFRSDSMLLKKLAVKRGVDCSAQSILKALGLQNAQLLLGQDFDFRFPIHGGTSFH
jgi:hypothetical protein